jgi:hypothetical protein
MATTRLFYDPVTGAIDSSYTGPWPTEQTPHYIDVEHSVRISDYKVNVETKQLESLPPQPPVIKRR